MVVFDWMHNEVDENHPYYGLIHSCKELINRDWEISVNHIYSKANRVAEALANMGHSCTLGFHFLRSSPCEVSKLPAEMLWE